MDTKQERQPVRRRQHSSELKGQVLAECAEPGASVAKVAMTHGLNANLVHKWRRLARAVRSGSTPAPEPAQFIALSLSPTAVSSTAVPASHAPHDIRIELRRGAMVVSAAWPVAAAAECAAWLRELLR